MFKISTTFMGLLAAAALASSSLTFAAEPGMAGDKGFLTDHHGATLYSFDKDKEGKSVCNDSCAINWPPLEAQANTAADGDWTHVKRDDGKLQWAYKGKPLYFYKDDKKVGDVTGDGKGGVWHTVKP